MAKHRDIADFLQQMHANFGAHNQITNTALALMRLARQAQRLNTLACTTGLTPRQEKAAAAIGRQAQILGISLGTRVLTNGDPRGFALKILLPDGTYNSWGGPEHGYGIPTL